MNKKQLRSFCFHTDILKTIIFNFHYFPFKIAIHLPVHIAYRTSFIKLKGSVEFHCPVYFGMIRLGHYGLGTQDAKFDRTKWEVDGKLIICGGARLGRGTNLSVSGTLSVGNNFCITGASTVICKHAVEFGHDVLISWDVLIMDTDFHKICNADGKLINEGKPIRIGNHVWIGCRTTILKGASVANDSVIAAASIISHKLDKEQCIYGGSNGRILKEDIVWSK